MINQTGLPNHLLFDCKREFAGEAKEVLVGMGLIISMEDVGKIFYTNPERTTGFIVEREIFLKMNPDDVGTWRQIGMFDVS